jgi:hypothetical protein
MRVRNLRCGVNLADAKPGYRRFERAVRNISETSDVGKGIICFGRRAGIASGSIRQHCLHVKCRSVMNAILLSPLVGWCGDDAAATYAAGCSTPLPGWGREADGVGHHLLVQPISIASNGTVLWNQAPISDDTLRDYMNRASSFDPGLHVILEVAPDAPCERVRKIRGIMAGVPLCQGPNPLCSEGANWEQWPVASGS